MPEVMTRPPQIVMSAEEIAAEIEFADLYDKAGERTKFDPSGYYWSGVIEALDWVLNSGMSPTEHYSHVFKRPRPNGGA